MKGFIEGLGIGALAMYFFDPDRGARRRAMVEDQWNRALNMKRNAVMVMQRDFRNRAQGMVRQAESRFRADNASDEVICERIRSAMGRYCTHPGAIMVTASGGNVLLQGDILASEAQDVVQCVKHCRGVKQVDNQLTVHDSPEGVSSLQGEGSIPNNDGRLTPGMALVVGSAGTLLTLYGLGRRGLVGTALGFVGASLVAKSLGDTEGRYQPMGGSSQGQSQPPRDRANEDSEPEALPMGNEAQMM